MPLKMRVLTKFPALVQAATGLAVTQAGRVYTFALKLMSIAEVASANAATRYIILSSDAGGGNELQERMSLTNFITQAGGAIQLITAGGPQTINAGTGTVVVNQTIGAPITLTLPLAATKIGPVKVVDWKGDAGTNPITVAPSGSETFNGGAASWVIGGNGASNVFTPYSGQGYAV